MIFLQQMIDKYKKFSLIIVAAGIGKRMGNDLPKQYIDICGKTILRHTLDIFTNMTKNICVVINPAHKDLFQNSIKGLSNITYCFGGDTRQQSVNAGIKELSHLSNDDIVLIHDAARPFVHHCEIVKLLDAMHENIAATLATPIADTLRYLNKNTAISRDNLWSIQTPQSFYYGTLKQAHENAKNTDYTDDAGLISDVKIIESSKENFKITTKEDLILAEKLLSTNLCTRTGQGFDVHAFDTTPAKNIRLCGIDIPFDKSLKGHSDADVGLHAITDAILGAIGEGDIGVHFPPSNNNFKNMDSALFVKHAIKHMQDKGGKIINIDLTLICESPKIGKHREQIIERLSNILEIAQTRINIKATTTEKLGFTGRGEGIAAQCIANISLPT